MLLADAAAVTIFQEVGSLLHQVFGGDFPDDPLNLGQIAVRAVFVYFATLVIIRLGKSRVISRTTTLDVVLGYILGSLVSRAVTGKASISGTIVAASAMVAAHWLFTAIACRWHYFGNLLKGNSYLVIKDGHTLESAMRHSHISIHDLIEQMHLAGIGDIQRVEEAFKERNGEISFIKRERPAQILEIAVENGVQTVRIALG